MTYFTYHWMHIPTNTKGTDTWLCVSREEFLASLSKANEATPGIWQYWE